jgi:FkbH-like protein
MNIVTRGPRLADEQSSSTRLAAAEAASAARDWPRAAGLWDALRMAAPHEPRHWLKAGEACYEAGMFERADEILGEAVDRFPDDPWIGHQHVAAARRRHAWDEMLHRAEGLRAAFPDFWPAWIETADALAALGRKAEADERRRAAATRFPEEYWTRYGLTRIEAEDSDSEGAVRIWSELVERFPTQATAAQGLEAAQQRLARQSSARLADSPWPGRHREERDVPVRAISDAEYRCPANLRLTETKPRRVMVIGSCLSAGWPEILRARYPDCVAEHFLVNNATVLPDEPPGPPQDYDFHLVQIHLRKLMREHEHFGLSYSDPAGFERLFDTVRERLSEALAEYMRWNQAHGILTFVCNFLVPQQNPMGRLLPRYDLRNFVYFIEKLNEALGRELQQYQNAYLFDLDQIFSTFGRRWMQDDAVWILTHGAALGDADWEQDRNRLEPLEKMSRYYPLATGEFVQHAWTELLAMYRTICQTDMVKLVLVDLDDTLWRGVAAEEVEVSSLSREGWPLGFAEALMFLKKRGILLGIVSKNDEDRVRGIWQRIYGDLIRPEDFAVRKINWQPKADNIEAILGEVNLLPKSVVFIDDNPVERAAVKAAFPDMRVLGSNPYLWRRILLWAPETQVAAITAESTARTEMVQKQVERETQKKRLSREEFLLSLEVRATVGEIVSTIDARFARALELINKTNQFNTTGKRWTQQELAAFFRDSGRCFVLEVTDRFTAYGIVGVLLVTRNEIAQFVMSCRVVGMDVEIAAVAGVLQAIEARGARDMRASLVPTSANLLCRDLWERCGFLPAGAEQHQRSADPPLAPPAHIALRLDPAPQPALSAAE